MKTAIKTLGAAWDIISFACVLLVLWYILLAPRPSDIVADSLNEIQVQQEVWIGTGTVAVLHSTQAATLYDCLSLQQQSFISPQRENSFSTEWRFVHCRIPRE